MTELERLVQVALAEDLVNGVDATSDCLIPKSAVGNGWIEVREPATVSGLMAAEAVFRAVDTAVQVKLAVQDGMPVAPQDHVMEISGPAISILKAERTALNLLCHLSGVATATNAVVKIAEPWGTRILCTRKTTPGLRFLEVMAVRHGGGGAYRTNLTDSVLIKDNHLGIVGGMDGVADRINALRQSNPARAAQLLEEGKIEAGSLDEVRRAVAMGWRQILLDNFTPDQVREAVEQFGKAAYLEVSGGVTLANIADYAATRVHAISIGAITHSSRAIDFSLEVEWRHK
ncbi:MAG: carboxylating nicotinate-nucleotide diphosphorylase [Calditrichota bacterium]